MRRRNVHRRHAVKQLRKLESLETRTLLAADLLSQWRAQDIPAADVQEGRVTQWTDQVGQIGAIADGDPVLVSGALGGRSAVRFDPSDGADLLRVSSADSPMSDIGDYTMAVVFQTNTTPRNGGQQWFHKTGLVDANRLGFTDDWGISISESGQVATGMGEGLLDPSATLTSNESGLNDGLPHIAIVARQAGTLRLAIDGNTSAMLDNASTDDRATLSMVIGNLQTEDGPFTGDIAEVRIYQGAMTPAEANQLHTDLLAYYNNQPANAEDDTYQLDEDPAFFFSVNAPQGVLANDSDPDGDSLTAELQQPTEHGTLTLNPDGSFLYAPETNFFGTDSFTYTANDFRPSQPATVTLEVRAVYDPAVAVDDQYKSLPTESLSIDPLVGVLANDLNPDQTNLTAVLSSAASFGTVTLRPDGGFDFDPQNQSGTAVFQYQIDDGTGLSQPGTVSIVVNTPPTSSDDLYQLDEDQTLSVPPTQGILANDSDVEGQTLQIELVSEPEHGTLELQSDGGFEYQPQLDYFGDDTFTYRLSDGIDPSSLATVSLNIAAVNDPAEATPDVYFGPLDTAIQVPAEKGVLANDTDVDSSPLSVQLVQSTQTGTLELDGDGSFIFTPDPGFIGSETFTYRTSDGQSLSSPVEVTLFVGRPPVRISEFLAANVTGLETRLREEPSDRFRGEVDRPDWIEVENLTTAPLDISGYHLTDDRSDPLRWTFPEGTTIPASGYLVIYATRAAVTDPALDETGTMHTNFRLDIAGEYLAITGVDGDVLFAYENSYPQQYPDISYGLDDQGEAAYFTERTPGQANSSTYAGLVSDTNFDVGRGLYSEPIEVAISTDMDEATIRYTLDGSAPTSTTGTPYSEPITIDRTTTLRAAAFRDGYLTTDVDTQTYIFVDQVIQQSDAPVVGPTSNPLTFPDRWGGQSADYEMDPEIAQSEQYGDRMQDALVALPSLSLTLDPENIFGRRGLYSNPQSTAEQASSAELIFPDGTEGFQVDAGARMQGGASRNPQHLKHSMSLRFREDYGTSELDFPLFAESAVTQFDSIHLRARYNNSWIHWNQGQRNRASLIREMWMRDVLLAAGEVAAGHGRYVHLYLNGLYWGVYEMHERQDASHYASYFGGNAYQYAATNAGQPVDGTVESWRNLIDVVRSGDWESIQQTLDVDNYIRWTIGQFYGGNQDLKNDGNWRTAGGGLANAPWQFYSWDSERILENVNQRNLSPVNDLLRFRNELEDLPEFPVLFADHLHQMLFNDGPLTPDNAAAIWMNRADQLDVAIVAESARWGDARPDEGQRTPLERDKEWITEQNRLIEDYFPFRTDNVISNFRRMDLYPEFDAPEFMVDDQRQHGGFIDSNSTLLLMNPNADNAGTVYLTLDGSDPRVEGGDVSPTAVVYDGSPIRLDETTRVRARIRIDDQWSAITQAVFLTELPASADNLRIVEIHYNPRDGEEEFGELNVDGDEFEFLEVQNVANQPIALHNTSLQSTLVDGSDEGVIFTFGAQVLQPGERTVVVRNLEAFQSRYGDSISIALGTGAVEDPAGQWTSGRLANGGELLTLADADGNLIQQFRYEDEGAWPERADGDGSSLEWIGGDPALGRNWNSSVRIGGTPGTAPVTTVPAVVVNEILTNSDAPQVDLVELHNSGGEPVDIGGWYLSDSGGELDKYQFPAGTSLQPGEYLVVNQTTFSFGFKGQESDDIFLTQPDESAQPSWFIDTHRFGATDPGVSLGRWPNATGALFPQTTATFGAANSGPLASPLILSEVHYHPAVATPDAEPSADELEYVELWNSQSTPLDISGWQLDRAVEYTVEAGSTLAADSGVVVVSFDPRTDTNLANQFRTHYNIGDEVLLWGPYQGVLDNGGENLALLRPARTAGSDAVLAELVRYDDRAPWPTAADGQGSSLQRTTAGSFANNAASWAANTPSPGTAALDSAVADFNGDGNLNLLDLDLLAAAIQQNDLAFDLNQDNTVDFQDWSLMVESILGLRFGDSTQDGRVDSKDLISVFQAGEYEDGIANNSTWLEGDWNGDQEFNTQDLVLIFQRGNYEA